RVACPTLNYAHALFHPFPSHVLWYSIISYFIISTTPPPTTALRFPAKPLFRSRSEERFSRNAERPVKAAELFAFTLRVRAGNTRSEERFSRNAETDLVCRLLLEKKKNNTTSKGRAQEPVTKQFACKMTCISRCT